MHFRDGSQSMVPKSKVVDAMYDGGELLHPMKFPDGSQSMVPHSRLAGAFKDGGVRLDSKPIAAASWEDYAGTAFGAATDTTLGAETGEKSLGGDVSEGLKRGGLGGAAKVAGAAAAAVAPALGLPSNEAAAQAAEEAAVAAAKSGPAPSLKTLFKIAVDYSREAEVAGGNIESKGAKVFSDLAYKGAAEARLAGHGAKALGYDAAALAAKGYGKMSAITTWLDKTIPGAPLALKIWAAGHLAREGYQWLAGSDDDEENK